MTYNEAPNVERTLRSVHGLCPIVVVDSGSKDETEAICRKYTDHFLVHPYSNHSSQWQWALENLPVKADWFLALDADFVVSRELRDSILKDLAKIPLDVDGIYVKHQYVFGWNPIRFGGTKKYWLRIVRLARAAVDLSDLVDFRFTVPGKTIEWNAKVTNIELQEVDVTGLQVAEAGDAADVFVTITWIDRNSMQVKNSNLQEHWVRGKDGWVADKPAEL